MATLLITGLEGFTGTHLARAARTQGFDVVGLTQPSDQSESSSFNGDLLDRKGLTARLAEIRPEYVVHLAAMSFVAHDDAQAIYNTNILGTRHLLEALDKCPMQPRRVILASSANVYGRATDDPITESTPPCPMNDYAVSKRAMEMMAQLWMDRLPIILTRPFNYTGPGQAKHFLVPKIVDHFRRRAPFIELGNLDVARDFSDIRFICDAYLALLNHGKPGETYNLCSGRATCLDEIVDELKGITGHEIDVRVNPDFVRRNEIKRLRGSNDKLLATTGPLLIPHLGETLRWMIETQP